MAIKLIQQFRDKESFLFAYNPDHQAKYCKHIDRIFRGAAPPVGLVAQAFGQKTAESWIEIQLNDLSEYSGCKGKLSVLQLEQTAVTIMAEYGHLKITELMYFFFLFKSGRFGRFYGAVDPLAITTALREFMKIRDNELDRIIKAERKQQRIAAEQEQRYSTMTYEEWEEVHWLFNMGYEQKKSNDNEHK